MDEVRQGPLPHHPALATLACIQKQKSSRGTELGKKRDDILRSAGPRINYLKDTFCVPPESY